MGEYSGMAEISIKQDIQAVYDLADQGMSLGELMDAIGGVLSRHEDALAGITYSYRLRASDTGYEKAFALNEGHFLVLGSTEKTDVTVIGKENDLQLVFQRKLSPMVALLRGKVKLNGSKAALIKLSEFL